MNSVQPPSNTATLPPAVTQFVQAVNEQDLDSLLGAFVGDAIVNDQLCEYCGGAAIRDWALQELFGRSVSVRATQVRRHHGQAILTFAVTGSFDGHGLPDPLLVTMYFGLSDDKIATLIALPKNLD